MASLTTESPCTCPPTSWAQLLIGQFATSVTIEGVDAAGTVLINATVNKPNSYWLFTISKNGLTTVRLTGGENEASIAFISMLVP